MIDISQTSQTMRISRPPTPPPTPGPPTPGPNEVIIDETLFNYPGSDIALRSCDSHDFPLPKLYILICSPVLGELIRSVSTTSDIPTGDGPEPLPVVQLPESGATLHSLLTFIFPVDPVLPSTSEKIMELLGVAEKYQMTSVLTHIRGIVARRDPPFIRPETAHGIYFLAQMYGLHEEATQAARVTLRLQMVLENMLDFPGLTGACIHELWEYHQRVQRDLEWSFFEFRKSGLPDGVKHLRCDILGSPIVNPDERPLGWLDMYIESIADAPHLFDPVAFEDDWTCHIKNAARVASKPLCSCADLSSELRHSLWKALSTFVHTAIEKVRIAGVSRRRRDN